MKKLPQIAAGLSITEVAGESIVYDGTTGKAHCLDSRGGQILVACRDGADRLELEEKFGKSEVNSGLQELQSLGLIEESEKGLGRREVLAAAGAGVASVLVASVIAPTPAAAATVSFCALDMSGNPCNCTRCGQPCGDDTRVPNCTGASIPSGPAIPGWVCCFEYRHLTPSITDCATEGRGDYSCRPVTPGVNFHTDCNTILAVLNGEGRQGLYYCCFCTGAPADRTC